MSEVGDGVQGVLMHWCRGEWSARGIYAIIIRGGGNGVQGVLMQSLLVVD